MSFSFEIKTDNQIIYISLKGNLMSKQQVQTMLYEIDHFFNEGVKKIIIDLLRI